MNPCTHNTTGRDDCDGCTGCPFRYVKKKYKRYTKPVKIRAKYGEVVEFMKFPRTAEEIAQEFGLDRRNVTHHILPAIRATHSMVSTGRKLERRHQVLGNAQRSAEG